VESVVDTFLRRSVLLSAIVNVKLRPIALAIRSLLAVKNSSVRKINWPGSATSLYI
jgi:hypothetical protein